MNYTIILALMGGLGLFLYGMKLMSDGLEKAAGAKLRRILEIFTTNRLTGMLVGIFFTAVIQSSSAATVMVVSFVNAGLMNLSQAAGVILGANIGTTVTSQLVSFNLSEIAPVFLMAGVIMVLFINNPTVQKVGEVVLGFGVLFMGLTSMSSAMSVLREVEKVEGLERIRFMTPHPKDLSDDLIEVMATSKKVCKHMHLPMQSGSSRLLKLMNRHYTKEQYVALAKKIQERIPGVSFTTDIIVGFPGETEEDFKETLDVVREVGFDSAYTYVYSKRSGTPAASMEDQVDKDVIKDRFDRLLALLKETSAKNCKKKVGDIERVLIEEENTHEEGMLTGRLENNLLVHFKGCKEQIGTMADVKLVEEKGFYYMGEQIHG